MLALDLDLEADLGIDTVKQAELFASVREEWGIPRDEKRKLRDYPTLNHVIAFVHQMRPDLAAPSPSAPPVPASAASAPVVPPAASVPTSAVGASQPRASRDPVREQVLALVTEKTGYPPDMLDVELDLEADLGVDTVKQAELFASVREKWGIPRDDNRKLRDYPTLRHVIDFVHQMRPDLEPTAAAPSDSHAVTEAPPAAAPTQVAADAVREAILSLVTEKTGYPARHARPRPGPRGRPRRRHREAGRALRLRARASGTSPATRTASSGITRRCATSSTSSTRCGPTSVRPKAMTRPRSPPRRRSR